MTKLRKLNQIIVSLTLVCLLGFSANVIAAENNIVAKGSSLCRSLYGSEYGY